MMAKAILLILVILWSVRVNSCEVDAFVMNVVERKDSLKKQEFFLRSLEEWAKRRVKADLQKLDELPKEQYQKLIDTAQHYQMDCGNGLRLSMWGKYALGWRRELTREEERSSRDIFFYGRSDTAYVLYDKSDALQALHWQFDVHGRILSQCIWRWPKKKQRTQEKGENESVNEGGSVGQIMYPPRILMFFDGDKPERVVDSAFVRRVRAITRNELVAFTRREDYRMQEQWKRTKNVACCVVFDTVLRCYFLATYLLVPTEDGRFTMYRVEWLG